MDYNGENYIALLEGDKIHIFNKNDIFNQVMSGKDEIFGPGPSGGPGGKLPLDSS